MNLHPIIVHFPIACLVLYTILEVLSFVKKSRAEKLGYTKIFLLVIGVVGSFFAIQSGGVAEEIVGGSDLIHAHEEYAEMTYKLYLIILILYIISREIIVTKLKNPVTQKIVGLVIFAKRYGIIALLSIIACVLLTITGALGGAISHGASVDPVVQFIYDLIMQ